MSETLAAVRARMDALLGQREPWYEEVATLRLDTDRLDAHLRDCDDCRAELDRLVGGSFPDWIRRHHDRQGFEETFRGQVEEWFGR